MGSFTVRRDVAAPADRVWAALVDWPAHGRWVPFTTVRTTSRRPDGVGARFVGRTGLGRFGFDDPMTVTAWRPPRDGRAGCCEIVKTGRVLAGQATLTVTPLGADRCRVDWTERVEVAALRHLPLVRRVESAAGAVLFAWVVRRLTARLEAS